MKKRQSFFTRFLGKPNACEALFKSLQVSPHPEFGYRPKVGVYEVQNKKKDSHNLLDVFYTFSQPATLTAVLDCCWFLLLPIDYSPCPQTQLEQAIRIAAAGLGEVLQGDVAQVCDVLGDCWQVAGAVGLLGFEEAGAHVGGVGLQ